MGPDCTVTIDSQHNLIIDIDTEIKNRCRALSTPAAPARADTPRAQRKHLMTATDINGIESLTE